ncbi:hypothetical protein [Micromonospora chersina]|uniref:hypothetical protein n=1 Tax=Micromonospora chersina TaxID=47854 RepID=UPI0033CAE630
MQHCKTRTANVLLAAAILVFLVAGVLATIDGAVSGRAFGVGLVGLGVATAALAANTRCVAGGLAVTVERAPRDQYYRGYGDAAEDALGDGPGPDDPRNL